MFVQTINERGYSFENLPAGDETLNPAVLGLAVLGLAGLGLSGPT
jgi:hypothetical protein